MRFFMCDNQQNLPTSRSKTGFFCGDIIEVEDVVEKPIFFHLPIQFDFSPTGEML